MVFDFLRHKPQPDGASITVISVGKPFPEACPDTDCVALTIDGSGLSYRIWLSAPVDAEAADLASECIACGFLPLPDCGGGLPLFIFQGGQGQWLIKAPLVAPARLVNEWVSSRVGNGAIFYLMERPSGMVRKIRTIGMAEDFMGVLATHWARGLHPADGGAYVRLAQIMDEAEMWRRAIKWAYRPGDDTFVRID